MPSDDALRFGGSHPGCLIFGGLGALVLIGGGVAGLAGDLAGPGLAVAQLLLGLVVAWLASWRTTMTVRPDGDVVRRNGPWLLARQRVVPAARVTMVQHIQKTAHPPGGVRQTGSLSVRLVLGGKTTMVVPELANVDEAAALARRLGVPFEQWNDARLKERREADGRLVLDPPPRPPPG